MKINFMGDVMLGELLETYRQGLITTLDRQTIDPFAGVRTILDKAEFNVINLECIFSDQSCLPLPFSKILIAPERYLEFLVDNRINVVNTANNHALDHGEDAFARSCALLQARGITIMGYEPKSYFQQEPSVIERLGKKLGFLGYNISNFSEPDRETTMRNISAVIANARPEVDSLVISMHWGEEYANLPPGYVIRYGKMLLEAGADIIHGHHSHQVQGVHSQGGKIFAPSLGNFVFDQLIPDNRITAILQVDTQGPGLRYDFLPCYLNDRYQPEPAPRFTDYLANITSRLAASMADGMENTCDQEVMRRIHRGHQANRRRMRLLMLKHFWDYLPHIKKIREYRHSAKKTFSVIDGLQSLPRS